MPSPLRFGVLLVLTALLILGAGGLVQAQADDGVAAASASNAPGDPAKSASSAAPVARAFPWPILPPTARGLTLWRRRQRRAIALALALLLSLFAVENAVHSVHHLTDQNRATACAVASAAQHVAGTALERVALEPPISPSADLVAESDPIALVSRSLRPDQERAPPSRVA